MDPEQEKMIEFERHLKVFLWPTADNASGVRDMNQIDKFKGKHEEAAASYIKWLADGYPRVKVENREIQRTQHLSNLDLRSTFQNYLTRSLNLTLRLFH